MATIPIEVIVQDAEAPVVPSEDGTNNTETNITVPDTGTISGNGETSSSASSIILPAILLVLAIGSIVAMLIHKYRKQNKAKTSKKEKLVTTAASTIAILAATVLVSNLILPATKAATSDAEDGIVPAEDKVSITVTRDGGVAEASIESTATVTSSSDFGYKVLLSMAEGVETSNLYLDGDTSSEYFIAATESTELTDNAWGYALVEDSEYSAVPLVDNPAIVAQGDEPAESENLNIYYGVKVSGNLPTGTYSGGEIEYSLAALEPSSISELTYMQDFAKLSTKSKASVLRSMTEDQQYYLKDNRDDKTYRIAKLKDGNIWMTQNLDLQKEDLLDGVILSNINTDSPAIDFELPISQPNDNTGQTNEDQPNFESLLVYDAANDNKEHFIKGNCLKYSYNGSCIEQENLGEIPLSEFGNHYNWYTATAGTGTSDLANNDVASGSVCPAGWRLPSYAGEDEDTDFSKLLFKYGICNTESCSNSYDINGDMVENLFSSPFLFFLTGKFSWSEVSDGEFASFWTSSNDGENSARSICANYKYKSVSVRSSDYKNSGNTVRCLAR